LIRQGFPLEGSTGDANGGVATPVPRLPRFELYCAHFGLSRRPFSTMPSPSFIVWTDGHAKAYAMLEYGLATFAPIMLLTGDVGAGKTTLVRQLLQSQPDGVRFAFLADACRNRGDILPWILSALGLPVNPDETYVTQFNRFSDALKAEAKTGGHTVLILDEAQNLSDDMMEELRCLSNINAEHQEVLQIILVGQPELHRALRQSRMMPFSQRISAQFHLSGMRCEAIRDYIGQTMAHAGADREIFTPSACDLVWTAGRGLPRVINQICDYALVYAYAEELDTVDGDVVRQVVRDLEPQLGQVWPLQPVPLSTERATQQPFPQPATANALPR
jgi:general secretion pathway protein A